jgi:hypothetical protein
MADDRQYETPTRLKVSQAAKAVGRARSTLNRDIATGKISVSRTGTGQPYIEVAELERAYGKVDIRTVKTLAETVHNGHDRTPEKDGDSALLRHELELLRQEREREREDAHRTIEDLRHRLDEERAERRQTTDRLVAAQSQIAALLTDQRATPPTPAAPPRRSWLSWRRRS